MAKFVLAGRADCPHFAKAELLADYLQKNLPSFRVHKITQHPDDWEHWLQSTCEKNGWKHTRSPIVWRELLDRGGKGLLLGGFNEFMEHAQHYYFNTSDMMTDLMLKIAEENLKTHLEIQKEEDELRSLINPLQIWITSASAPSCYSLIPLLASGEVFGMTRDISIHLLDRSDCEEVLRALVMEAEDLAFPLLRGVAMHTVSEEAFLHADIIIVLDDFHQQEDQSSEHCARQAADRCKEYGSLIEHNASEGVKIIVAGSTVVNLKALVIVNHVPSALKHHVIAVAMQLECEAKAQLAKKLNVNASVVKDVIVWGNISGVNFLDLSQAKIYQYDSAIWGPPSYSRPLLNMIYDSNWMKKDFLPEWTSRKKHRAGMSAAHTVATMLRYWNQDSPAGEIVSVGVISEGQFGIPEGIIFSMPVKFQGGKWEVLSDVVFPDEMKEKFLEAISELIKEKEIVLPSQQISDSLTEQASDLLTQKESGLPAQQIDLPVQQDSAIPTQEENVQATQQGSALPIDQDGVLPVQQESAFTTQQEGALPTQQEGALPTQQEGTIPTQQEGDLPTQQEGDVPTQQEGTIPTQQEGALPTQQEGGVPTQQEAALPIQQEGDLPYQQESVLPTPKESVIPTPQDNVLSS